MSFLHPTDWTLRSLESVVDAMGHEADERPTREARIAWERANEALFWFKEHSAKSVIEAGLL